MKVIICGGRDFNDYKRLKSALDFYLQNMDTDTLEIVHGDCRGTDQLAQRYAEELDYEFKKFPADWKTYGKGAGPRRNAEMAKYGEVCIAFWDGESTGTADMIKKARINGLKVKVIKINQNNHEPKH